MTEPLECYDCGLRYDDPGWFDVTIPDEDWLAISPTGHEGGVLCVICMAYRLVEQGREQVPAYFGSGPLAPTADQDEFGRLLRESE